MKHFFSTSLLFSMLLCRQSLQAWLSHQAKRASTVYQGMSRPSSLSGVAHLGKGTRMPSLR